MKKVRVFYYLMMAVWLFGGMVYGLRTFYIALIAQIFLLGCCVGLNFWTFFSFTYKQELDRTSAVKGENVQLRLSIHNGKPFPFTTMKLHMRLVDVTEKKVLEFNLAPNSEIAFDIPVDLPYRGEYKVGISVVEIHDLFDLVPMRFRMRRLSYYHFEKVLVFPRLVRLPLLRAANRDAKLLSGRPLDSNSEHDSYSHTREYRAGDSARFIHWKLSMRQHELFTRQYDLPIESYCYVFVDNALATLPEEDEPALVYADTVCEIAAAIVYHSLAKGHNVRIMDCCPRRDPLECKGPADFGTCYEWLARLGFEEDGALPKIMGDIIKPRVQIGSIYVITREMTDDLRDRLQNACRRGIQVTAVMTEEGQPAQLPGGARALTVRSADDFAQQMARGGLL